ncbi:hypothetical protein C8R44DRAFT_735314 [Mycena epipterygia]|nr:hypothetical protein C8R44DRAFT_735314 [Mycena epipterygia]
MPPLPHRRGKVVILAQFGHRYYIHGTLKWLTGVLTWLKAWWICTSNPYHCCLAGEETHAKVVILAQFGHRYYIRGTLKRLTDVLAWIAAWWICVSVKQVTDQKSMPLLAPHGGKVVILAQFDHGYYIHETLKWLTGVLAWLKAFWICAWWICLSVKQTIQMDSSCYSVPGNSPMLTACLWVIDHVLYPSGPPPYTSSSRLPMSTSWVCKSFVTIDDIAASAVMDVFVQVSGIFRLHVIFI